MKYLENPVFICGHRKTGTTMLINLFDGTREAVVYPDDSGLFYLYYPRYDSERFSLEQKLERLAEVIVSNNLKSVIDESKHDSETKKLLYAKNEDFKRRLLEYEGSALTSDILKHFIYCFHQAFYLDMKAPKLWIEKTTSTEIYALNIMEMFPRAKFIHLIRDPRDNWASLKSGWEERYKNFNDDLRRLKQSLLERGKLGLEMAKANLQTLGSERYRVIKFEDFTADPGNHMRELCNFIGIEFSASMLVPSTFGCGWEGNSFDGRKFNGASKINVNRWKERIDAEDAQLIEFHFRDIMEYFGYKCEFAGEACQKAATEHYKWFNFSTPYSAK